MSGNYQRFNTETKNNTIADENVPQTNRAGSAGNLFEDMKLLNQRVETLEKKVEELTKSCPHNNGKPMYTNS